MESNYVRLSMLESEGLRIFRYHSGRQVWDECLMEGGYIRRYANCNGQILPENHYNQAVLKQMDRLQDEASCFRLAVNGKSLNAGWSFVAAEEMEDSTNLRGAATVYAVRLRHEAAGVEVKLCTRMDGSDFLVRWLEVENQSGRALALTRVSPLSGRIFAHRYTMTNGGDSFAYYQKEEALASGSLYEIAWNHHQKQLYEGDFYFEPVEGALFEVKSGHGRSGFARPGFWVRDRSNDQTLVCELAYPGNYEFRAWHRDLDVAQLNVELGMLELDGEALRVLQPGEKCVTPAVHFGLFQDSNDRIVQLSHAHVRGCVIPELPEGVPAAEIEANHRGYLCDHENEPELMLDIDAAKAVGCELYVIDAGWYGRDYPNEWWNIVGDWTPGPWLEHGLRPIAEHAHAQGMRFGLWIEIEAFGPKCKIREEHPEYIMTRHGVPCAGGRALNLADPAVEKFCLDTIDGAVRDYALDMYRIDHNHEIGLGGTRVVGEYVENTLWRYYEAFARIFTELRRRHPGLVLQNCASGGGRLDLGTMSLFHNTEMSDWLRNPRAIRIFNGLTMALPPEILMRCFGTESPEIHMDGDLEAQLRGVALCRPILRGIAPSPELLTPYLAEKIARFMELYKEFTRPLLGDCLVYHHTPWQPVAKASRQVIVEYASPDHSRGLIAIFNTAAPLPERTTIVPRGLKRAKIYRVRFENEGDEAIMDGAELMRDGVSALNSNVMGSELILFEEIN